MKLYIRVKCRAMLVTWWTFTQEIDLTWLFVRIALWSLNRLGLGAKAIPEDAVREAIPAILGGSKVLVDDRGIFLELRS